jgi:transposase
MAALRGDSVSKDNLRAHQATGIRAAIEPTGARHLFLPPYAPDLSPIERCWAQLKTAWRNAKARTREALETAITEALRTITATDAHGWLTYSGDA